MENRSWKSITARNFRSAHQMCRQMNMSMAFAEDVIDDVNTPKKVIGSQFWLPIKRRHYKHWETLSGATFGENLFISVGQKLWFIILTTIATSSLINLPFYAGQTDIDPKASVPNQDCSFLRLKDGL